MRVASGRCRRRGGRPAGSCADCRADRPAERRADGGAHDKTDFPTTRSNGRGR